MHNNQQPRSSIPNNLMDCQIEDEEDQITPQKLETIREKEQSEDASKYDKNSSRPNQQKQGRFKKIVVQEDFDYFRGEQNKSGNQIKQQKKYNQYNNNEEIHEINEDSPGNLDTQMHEYDVGSEKEDGTNLVTKFSQNPIYSSQKNSNNLITNLGHINQSNKESIQKNQQMIDQWDKLDVFQDLFQKKKLYLQNQLLMREMYGPIKRNGKNYLQSNMKKKKRGFFQNENRNTIDESDLSVFSEHQAFDNSVINRNKYLDQNKQRYIQNSNINNKDQIINNQNKVFQKIQIANQQLKIEKLKQSQLQKDHQQLQDLCQDLFKQILNFNQKNPNSDLKKFNDMYVQHQIYKIIFQQQENQSNYPQQQNQENQSIQQMIKKRKASIKQNTNQLHIYMKKAIQQQKLGNRNNNNIKNNQINKFYNDIDFIDVINYDINNRNFIPGNISSNNQKYVQLEEILENQASNTKFINKNLQNYQTLAGGLKNNTQKKRNSTMVLPQQYQKQQQKQQQYYSNPNTTYCQFDSKKPSRNASINESFSQQNINNNGSFILNKKTEFGSQYQPTQQQLQQTNSKHGQVGSWTNIRNSINNYTLLNFEGNSDMKKIKFNQNYEGNNDQEFQLLQQQEQGINKLNDQFLDLIQQARKQQVLEQLFYEFDISRNFEKYFPHQNINYSVKIYNQKFYKESKLLKKQSKQLDKLLQSKNKLKNVSTKNNQFFKNLDINDKLQKQQKKEKNL